MKADNGPKDLIDLPGVVSTDGFIKRGFFSDKKVGGQLVFDPETEKVKDMTAACKIGKSHAFESGIREQNDNTRCTGDMMSLY